MPEARPDEDRGEEQGHGAEGDLDALLATAREKRAARDLRGCFEAYQAAADLGSGEAEYAVALFLMSGTVVPQDAKAGATRLRSAAEKGSVPAKVYLGNLYELGIHYRADPEKADVWYRNAARSARIDLEAGTDEHAHALAELGCVRYVLALLEGGELDEAEKARLLARAKAHGYGWRPKEADATAPDADASGDRGTLTDALFVAEDAKSRQRADTAPATRVAREKVATARQAKTKRRPSTQLADGLAAFGYAILFATAGVGAAYAATLGARELVARGTPLPGLGTRTDLVLPIVLFAVGVLPAWLVYKPSAFAKGLFSAAIMGGIGWVAWGAGQILHESRTIQSIAFTLAGFLASLLVLGILGGTKLKKRPAVVASQ